MKFIRIALIVLLTLLIIILAVAQTDYARGKLVHFIEMKSAGSLKIGRIEGILPFWAHLYNVHYQSDTLEGQVDEVIVSFLPAALFYGHLVIADMHIGNAGVRSTSKEWPSFPLPIDIHHFDIKSLTYNDIKDMQISGMAALQETLFLKLSIEHPQIPGRVNMTVESDPEHQTFHTISQFKSLDNSDELWVSATYRWNDQTLVGIWNGKKNGLPLTGSLEINRSASTILVSGIFLDKPFTIESDLNLYSRPLILNYGDNQWKMAGQFDVAKGLLNFHLHGNEITCKKVYVPDMVMQGALQIGLNNTLQFNLDIPDFIVMDPAYEVFPQVRISVNGNATQAGVTAQGTLLGISENPFNLSAQLPIRIQSPLIFDINEDAPFFIRICGSGTLDPLLAFLENASLIAKGRIDLDLQASGTWNNPELSGHLVYAQGQIESFSTGALFHDIHLEMEGIGNTLQIKCLRAHDNHQGELSGTGSIQWDPDHHFPFTLNLNANRYLILGVDPLTLTVNAEVSIDGSTQGMLVSGYANLVEGHLAIASGLPVQVPTVAVTYINPIRSEPFEEDYLHKAIPIIWDLRLNADRYLHIEGRGLNSEWRGTLHITGEQNQFLFNGKLRLVNGRFDIINQTFNLVHGRILIAGLEPHDIFLDLKGDYELPSLTASILVTGSLDNSRISFCSNPPLNTNQILSWILFREDINELTPMQACRLASILVSLSGKYSGPKTFEKIKDKLGIDVFSITDCDIDSADLTFQVGKYLSQGTFVGINKSISGDYDSVLIQTRLFRNFYLEADYGGSLNGLTPNGGKGILKWYKTY